MNSLKSKLVVMALALASLLTFSTAAQAGPYATQIQQVYVAIFGRPATAQELATRENDAEKAIARGYNLSPVLTEMGDSMAETPEFKTKATSPLATVKQMYQNMTGEIPDDNAGPLYWASLLERRQISLGDLAVYLIDGMQNPRKTVFANKVAAAMAPANTPSVVVDLAKNNATDAVSNAVTSTVSHVSESAVGSAVTAAANAAAKAATDAASKAAADAASKAAAAAVDEN